MNQFHLPATVALLLLATACSTSHDPAPTTPLPEHLTLGNPSGATPDANQPTNYLLSKPQYALSYHRDRGIPTWVSWHPVDVFLPTCQRS